MGGLLLSQQKWQLSTRSRCCYTYIPNEIAPKLGLVCARLHNCHSVEMQFQPTLRSFYIQLWFLGLPRCCRNFSLVRGRRKQKRIIRDEAFSEVISKEKPLHGAPRMEPGACRKCWESRNCYGRGQQWVGLFSLFLSSSVTIDYRKLVRVSLQVWKMLVNCT